MIEFGINAVGVLAPGLRGWPESRSVLSGEDAYLFEALPQPAPDILPPNERRRSGVAARLAVAVAQQALRASTLPAKACATVFASSDGDGDIVNAMCVALAASALEVSPTKFHNSVHNAPAGYWAIATGCEQSASSVSAYDATFAAGLIEAAAQVSVERRPVLLVAFDIPFPPPLDKMRTIANEFAVALVLVPSEEKNAVARVCMTIENGCVAPQADVLAQTFRLNPAGAALPLLRMLARARPGLAEVAYREERRLALDLTFP